MLPFPMISSLQVQHAPSEVGPNYVGWSTVACDCGEAKGWCKKLFYRRQKYVQIYVIYIYNYIYSMLDVQKPLVDEFSKSGVQML